MKRAGSLHLFHLSFGHIWINEVLRSEFLIVGFPLQEISVFMLGIKHFLSFFLNPLAHLFSVPPSSLYLSKPTSLLPPFPLVLFLFASALRGLRVGCTTLATPFWQTPLLIVGNGTILLCISFLRVGRMWRPVPKELLVPFERFGYMSWEKLVSALVYRYRVLC